MSPPTSRARDRFVVGKLGSYECRTLTELDGHLRKLRTQRATACGAPLVRILADIDSLLERRVRMQREAG